MAFAGTFFVTTEPAPIIALLPTVMPHNKVALEPTEAPSSIMVSMQTQSDSACNEPSSFVERGNLSFIKVTLWPIKTLSFICTPSQIKLWLDILQFLPMVAPF